MSPDSSDFSPSVHHRHVLRRSLPALSYRGGDVKAWQRRFRRKLRGLMGTIPPERVPLNARTLWRRDHELGTVEKIVFAAEPRADVPAYVCLPRQADPPYTFMICLQGHTTGMHNSIAVGAEDETEPVEVAGDRDFAIGCMARGIAALCIEQRSLGQRRELLQQAVSPHPCHDAALHALKLGRTLAGERVFDVDRGIDYLRERDDANMRRIGVMGNSGGGMISIYAAALLRRVAFAMPSCAFCTFADSIMRIYHCADNYVPALLKWGEMADVMGLFAPRPVVIVAGKGDPIFPIAGVRKAFRTLKKIYAAAGAPGNYRLIVGNEGHRFYAVEGWRQLLRYLSKPE